MSRKLPKTTLWRVIFAAILLAGLYATYLRVMYGLAGSTNLTDRFPWGLWIGFDAGLFPEILKNLLCSIMR